MTIYQLQQLRSESRVWKQGGGGCTLLKRPIEGQKKEKEASGMVAEGSSNSITLYQRLK